MGSRNSMPASSAICANFRLLSQEASQRSGTFVTAMPPEQFGEKMPSFSLLSLNMVVRGGAFEKDMNLPRFNLENADYTSRLCLRKDSGLRGWPELQST